MKKLSFLLFFFYSLQPVVAQQADSIQMALDKIEGSLQYQYGQIHLENGIGTINVPKGFRYLDAKQTELVLRDLWGNPDGSGTLGLIAPDSISISSSSSWAFIITYDEMGYVKDDDAADIDYDDLLDDMKKDNEAANIEREKLGYNKVSLVGWAAKPFYDEERKVLHWAKELNFEDNEENTLNYNIRILGRKGVVVLNAVSSMSQLPEVENNIQPMLASFQYAEGNAYSDFNPDIDDVAAWTIGGLVAGKVLTKVGFFAFFLKYLKIISVGLIAAASALWKLFKRKTEPPVVRNFGDSGTSQS